MKSFRKIYDVDIKKRGIIEIKYFTDAYKIKQKVKYLKKLIKLIKFKYKSNIITSDNFEEKKDKINNQIKLRKEQYNQIINNKLKIISDTVNKKGYSLPLQQLPYQVKGKSVFSSGNCIEEIFVSKQIQYILKNVYNVNINDRDLIISRISKLGSDKSPKYIIRSDIKSFYESIEHKRLLDILHSSPNLSVTSRRIITQLLRDYKNLTGNDTGLPRGIGISSYLSEIYMEAIDSDINNIEDVTYYERYVDDLIVILSPKKADNINDYLTLIKGIISKQGLETNSKTKELDLYNGENKTFDYLGYKFSISMGGNEIRLSKSKKSKIQARIDKSFDDYDSKYKKQPKKAYKMLLLRIKFLTGNTQLYNSKSKAFVGVYFSNKFINSTKDLVDLDRYLIRKIAIIQNIKLKKRLSKLSFKRGFDEKVFRKFCIKELSSLSRVWKNV